MPLLGGGGVNTVINVHLAADVLQLTGDSMVKNTLWSLKPPEYSQQGPNFSIKMNPAS